MGLNGLKVISYSYKDMKAQDFDSILSRYENDNDKLRDEFEKNLVYLGSFGLNDEIRENIYEHIHFIKYGHSDIDADHPE